MDKSALVETACQELMTYGVWDKKSRLKYWIKKYLLRRPEPPEDLVFWPTGLLAAGLWQYRREGSDADATLLELLLQVYYDRWIDRGCRILWLDDLLAGETLLNLYEDHRETERKDSLIDEAEMERYGRALEKLASYALAHPADEIGSFLYRARQNNGFVFVDSIGLACPFLYRYGVVFEKQEPMELAVKQIVNFLAYGMDAATGLPYHGYSIADDCKYGIIGWGRAVGWLLRGMSGSMITQYGRERLAESYIKVVDAALGFQRRDGYFAWQLQAVEGPADTSATGMICVALKQGIELGILQDPKYEAALQDGRAAMERAVGNGRVYQCSGECEGFGQYPQRYGSYPWALGPALML